MNISKLQLTVVDPGTKSTGTAQSPDGLSDKSTFLKLLVSQMKNQNPLNPTDSTQYVTQLAQFSQVEQLVSIRQTLDSMKDSKPATTIN